MKYELIISDSEEERVIIYAKEISEVIDKIIYLVQDEDKKLWGYRDNEAVALSTDDIECITVLGGKPTAITKNGSFSLKDRLYSLEEALGCDFIRINKSSLANLKKIHSFSASFGGSLMITFKCGYRDYVSRRQQKSVKERLK